MSNAGRFTDGEVAVLKRLASRYIASEKEIHGQYGDKEVKKDPPFWNVANKGSFVGRKWSECPPDYLYMLAGLFEWKAEREKEKPPEDQRRKTPASKPYWMYDENDARLMRGWAAFIAKDEPRKVADSAGPPPARSLDDDDEIPF